MELQTLTYLVVGATFALYIGIAIWARASTTGEFYVAGTGIHPIANGMATAADWMSAASFISMAGLIAFLGYDASVYLMGWTGGYVLLALLLAPYLRKFGKFTVPEFIGDRFYSKGARLVAAVTEKVNEKELIKKLRESLAPIEVPNLFVVIPEMPKLGSGKINFRLIEEKVCEMTRKC